MPQTAPCEKCRKEISTKAQICPECGYNPSGTGKRTRQFRGLLAIVCILSVVGIPIGALLLLTNKIERKRAKEKRPAVQLS